MLAKLFNIFTKTQKTQIYKHWGSNVITFKINGMCTDAVHTDISLKDKEEILKVINNSKSKEDLLQYSITKKCAENLESHRIKNGSYNSLEDLLQVKGMNNKCLHKFYESIIKKRTVSKKFKLGLNLIMAPKMNNDDQKDVNTVLGIYIGKNMISWSLLNRDCEVLQWDYKLFPEAKSMNNLHSLLQMVFPIAKMLPKAERYIMQESMESRGNIRFYRSYIQESIIATSILSYLSCNHKLDSMMFEDFVANNIFILRQRTIQKVYGLLVNKEVIATKYILQKLLQENDIFMTTKERLPNVLISTELRNMYEEQNPVHQEQISWSLLIALAFLELVVHQRTDIISHNAVSL